jgi:hypothetical protein
MIEVTIDDRRGYSQKVLIPLPPREEEQFIDAVKAAKGPIDILNIIVKSAEEFSKAIKDLDDRQKKRGRP